MFLFSDVPLVSIVSQFVVEFVLVSENSAHTAPDWCQPDKFATLSFSAFLVVCDRDKKPHVGQQIL